MVKVVLEFFENLFLRIPGIAYLRHLVEDGVGEKELPVSVEVFECEHFLEQHRLRAAVVCREIIGFLTSGIKLFIGAFSGLCGLG